VKIAVVGGCGSGKTTVVDALRARGYDAYVVGQEHSAVATLWRRQSPDALVFLDVSLDVVRRRRGEKWPQWLFERQSQRLSDARASADVIVDTGKLSIDETAERVIAALSPPD
jgi:deoxyadenosine/deoxycytidine kinase